MSDWWSSDPVAAPVDTGRPKITITPTQRAFLNGIYAGESGGKYDVMYGGGKITDFADHPRQAIPIRSGPNAGKTSSAAGAPQFLGSTWDEAKNALGLPDFSSDSQDAAAAWLAERDYKKRTNRNLWDDVESAKDNPSKLNLIAGALNKTWTSLPGGIEPNSASNSFGRRVVSELSAQANRGNNWWANDPVATENRQPEGPARAPVGMGEAVARGIQQGASFNFGDEIKGLKAASGIPEAASTAASVIPGAGLIAPAIGAARMGYEALAGGDGATNAYNQKVEAERERERQAQQDRPYSYGGGQVAGAIAVPVGGALNGATLPIRMARGAGVGAAMGAVSGAGEGSDALDRGARAATGAVVGGAIGGVAPPVVEGALQLGRAAVNPVVTAVRGAVAPETEAARRVAGALRRDFQNDPAAVSRLTPQEFGASVQSGGPAAIMDIGGDTTRALARSAANTSPEGRATLNQAINDRYEGQTGRVTEWLRNTFHFPNADAQQQAIEQTARNTNRAAYARAYRDGANGIWTPELERLAGSPEVTAAMQAAAKNAKSESVVSGYGAMNPRITFTQDGRIQFNRAPNGMPTYPDLQYWDLVRRELSDAAQRAGRGTSESRRLGQLANMMNAELDNAVPSYRTARQGAASFFGAENALEAGQNFVTQNFGIAETRRALAGMSQQERQLFQDGFVSRYVDTLERTGDRRNVLNQIASSPAAREKLNLALGRQRAAELEAGLRVEGIMDLARGAVQGNSTTARQLVEIGLAGGSGVTGITGVYNQDPGTLTVAAVSAALLAGKRGIDTRVARSVAEMLVSNDPRQLLRGIRSVANSNRLMDNLRIADRKIASVGAQEAPKGLISVRPMGAYADDQPEGQRPRGQ